MNDDEGEEEEEERKGLRSGVYDSPVFQVNERGEAGSKGKQSAITWLTEDDLWLGSPFERDQCETLAAKPKHKARAPPTVPLILSFFLFFNVPLVVVAAAVDSHRPLFPFLFPTSSNEENGPLFHRSPYPALAACQLMSLGEQRCAATLLLLPPFPYCYALIDGPGSRDELGPARCRIFRPPLFEYTFYTLMRLPTMLSSSRVRLVDALR